MKKAWAVLAASGMLAVGVAGGTAGTASAASATPSVTAVQGLVSRVDNAPNPGAAFNKLSSADQTRFKEAVKGLVSRVDNAANPKAAFNKLSSGDKKLLRDVNTPYGAPKNLGARLPQSRANLPYTGCWGHYDKVELRNAFGWTLAQGEQETHICAWNGIVYKVWVDSQDGKGFWAWSWDQSNTGTTTYNAYWEGRGAVRFAYNVYGTGDATLCLRIFVNGNGYNWRTDHNCPARA